MPKFCDATASRAFGLTGIGSFLDDFLGLEPPEHLVHDLGDLELPGAERKVEVLGLLEPISRMIWARAASPRVSCTEGCAA
jgi:hypothetical protein